MWIAWGNGNSIRLSKRWDDLLPEKEDPERLTAIEFQC